MLDLLGRRNRLAEALDESRKRVTKLIRQAILRRRLPFFQKLLKEDKAWALYVSVIEKYIKGCKEKKLNTNYAKASSEQKKLLEQMDIEIATLEWMIMVPARTIKRALVQEHQEGEKVLAEEVRSEVEAEKEA